MIRKSVKEKNTFVITICCKDKLFHNQIVYSEGMYNTHKDQGNHQYESLQQVCLLLEFFPSCPSADNHAPPYSIPRGAVDRPPSGGCQRISVQAHCCVQETAVNPGGMLALRRTEIRGCVGVFFFCVIIVVVMGRVGATLFLFLVLCQCWNRWTGATTFDCLHNTFLSFICFFFPPFFLR